PGNVRGGRIRAAGRGRRAGIPGRAARGGKDLMNDPTVEVNLLGRQFVEDPYGVYEEMRRRAPLAWDPNLNIWVVLRQEEARRILADEIFEVVDVGKGIEAIGQRSGRDLRFLARTMDAVTFFRNGEKHRLSRRAVGRAMTRTPVSQLKPV